MAGKSDGNRSPITATVSVLMPVYNAAPFLAEAIQSILVQTMSDFEFIIVNDGSTDGSGEIIRRYAADDPRIRVIEQGNTGLERALNRGLAECHGEFVARMDADDVAMPERLRLHAQFLAAHPEVVAVGSSFRLIDAAGSTLGARTPPTDHAQIECSLLAGDGQSLCQPSVMMRRSALERVGFYQRGYQVCDDMALFLELARIGHLANVPEVLLCYRKHAASITATRLQLQKEELYRLRQEAYRVRGLPLPRGFHWRPPEKEPEAWYSEEGWRAWKEGDRLTMIRHAAMGLARSPVSSKLWKLGLCALLKRCPSHVAQGNTNR